MLIGVIGGTYAFINLTLEGTKKQVIQAGTLDLVLDEDENNLTITNALPMYDEVGMIQDPFTFRLINNGTASVNYKLKLVNTTPESVQVKCSDLEEITLNSPNECRKIGYPTELRAEALSICQDWFSAEDGYPEVVDEASCLEANEIDGSPYNSFEEWIDDLIYWGDIEEDTRFVAETYPANNGTLYVRELELDFLRYGLTKDGENAISGLVDLPYDLNNSKIREEALEVCKQNFPNIEITDEASCLATLELDDVHYDTFDDYMIRLINRNIITKPSQILDSGKIAGGQTIEYGYRMWIADWITDNSWIKDCQFSFKLEVEVGQEIELSPSIVFDKMSKNIGTNCTTYNDGTDTFLVGQCSNNYVWYSGKLWRVVLKNNETGAVKMVTDNAITAIPYNASGNTAFKDSYMDQWLNQEFLPTLHDYEDYLVTNSIWDATTDSSSTPARPKGTTTVERTVGLLNVYEYYTTYAQSGGLDGYLNNGYWWLITPYSASSVRIVNDNGTLGGNGPANGSVARPSVNLKSTIQIDSGSGIQSDPYILKGDIQETTGGTTLLSTRYSGEYVTFNNELYRIVGVENGLTKITAVDKPSSLASNKFHSATGVTSFADASIKTDLETYYQGIKTTNETAFNMIEPNTTWYLGGVGSGDSFGNYHYKASICANVDTSVSMNACTSKATSTTASIALPRVGEMFTSQITRGKKDAFWTLTPYDASSRVRSVGSYGNLSYNFLTHGTGARPSMYLKSTIKIASGNTGNGTYEYPYQIELSA